MGKDILLFAAKDVGTELFDYLLQTKAPIDRLIAGGPDNRKILDLAKKNGIPAGAYEKHTQAQLADEGDRYEWLLNLYSPHILRPDTLALADHRLNAHSSLVPHCRGNDGSAWAIRKGLPAGVSLIEIRDGIDEGEVYCQTEVPYFFPVPGFELHERLK